MNDSDKEEENDSYNKNDDRYDDGDDELNESNIFQNDDKNNITSYMLKIKKAIKQ